MFKSKHYEEALCSKILVVKSAAEEGLAALVYIFSLVLDVTTRSCREDHHNLSLSSVQQEARGRKDTTRPVPSMSNSRWAEALNSLSTRSPPSRSRRRRCLRCRGETGMHVTHQKVLRHSSK
jgi:hypothetical protein